MLFTKLRKNFQNAKNPQSPTDCSYLNSIFHLIIQFLWFRVKLDTTLWGGYLVKKTNALFAVVQQNSESVINFMYVSWVWTGI